MIIDNNAYNRMRETQSLRKRLRWAIRTCFALLALLVVLLLGLVVPLSAHAGGGLSAGDTEVEVAGLEDATHYHAVWVQPSWSTSLEKRQQIGGHVFYAQK